MAVVTLGGAGGERCTPVYYGANNAVRWTDFSDGGNVIVSRVNGARHCSVFLPGYANIEVLTAGSIVFGPEACGALMPDGSQVASDSNAF